MKKPTALEIIALTFLLISAFFTLTAINTVTANSDLLSLPAAYYSQPPYHLATTSLENHGSLTAVSQQTVAVSPGQSVSMSITYTIYAPYNPNEIDQLFLVESWTPTWPPAGYTISLYNDIPGTSSRTKTQTISFNAPLVAGTYYLWLCYDAQYTMQNAVNQRTSSMAGLPAHFKVVVSGSVASPTPVPTAASLVGYWKFDEGSGSTTVDGSGNGNTGNIHGASWVAGVAGQALQFNGLNSYVAMPQSSSLDISGSEISIEYWISFPNGWQAHSSNVDQIIYDKGDAYTACMVASTGALRFNIPYVMPYPETNKKSWDSNTWYHVANVFDGAQIRIYVNGQLDTAAAVVGSVSRSSINLAIGSHCYGDKNFLLAAIDEFKIYSYARTATEISNDYNTISNLAPYSKVFDPQTDGFSFQNFGFIQTSALELYNLLDNNQVLSPLTESQKKTLSQIAYNLIEKSNESYQTYSIGGHCYGMSASARNYFINPNSPQHNKVGDLTFEQASPQIRSLQISAYADPFLLANIFRLYAGQSDNLAELNKIQSAVNTDGVAMVLLQNSITETPQIWFDHEVLVFKIDETSSGWSLWTYDSNYPGITRFIEVDKTGSFSYKLNVYDNSPSSLIFDRFAAPLTSVDALSYLEKFVDGYLTISLHSPATITTIDASGRGVGSNQSGLTEIQDALYSGLGSSPQVIIIPNPTSDNYKIEVTGTSDGAYTLNLDLLSSDNVTTLTFVGNITSQEVHQYNLEINGEMPIVTRDSTVVTSVPKNSETFYAIFVATLSIVVLVIAIVFKKRKNAAKSKIGNR
jgi:hypothetical protein